MTEQELLQKLRDKRKEIALREGRPLFQIFSNEVLEMTARVAPKNIEDIAEIKGWGPIKTAKYGQEIIAVISGEQAVTSTPLTSKDMATPVLSVEQFIGTINLNFQKLGIFKVKGEITEVNDRSSYVFFTIKDSGGKDSSLKCFLGWSGYKEYRHLLEVGLEVLIDGRPSIYKNGGFSLEALRVEPFGEGAIKRAFELLKKKLDEKGYFDPTRKRPLPFLVKKIGLITSSQGDAIKDFWKNIGKHKFQIFHIDTRVEGDYAEHSIVSALRWFTKNKPDLDVLVLIRGGGGMENLKVFNSEKIADAIIESHIPVLTGIGHDKDISIADLAADIKCSTPTAVAVLLRSQREKLNSDVQSFCEDLSSAMENILWTGTEKIRGEQEKLQVAFGHVLGHLRARISKLGESMSLGLEQIFSGFRVLESSLVNHLFEYSNRLNMVRVKVERCEENSIALVENALTSASNKVKVLEASLLPLNPEAILEKGYSLVYTADNQVLHDAKDIAIGQGIHIKLHKGEVRAKVENVKNS